MLNFFKSKTHFFTLPLLFLTMFLLNVPVYAQSSPILVIDEKS
jgi:hypothetical protein